MRLINAIQQNSWLVEDSVEKNILSIETIYIRRGDIGVKKTPTISESFLRLQTRRREQDEDNDQTQGKEHKYTIQKKLKTQMDSPESTPSAPLSPSTTMTSTHSDTTAAMHDGHEQAQAGTTENTLDDIFGSSPPAGSNGPTDTPDTPAEPSDLPSLRRQHVTAGYRDGITTSKGQHVQDGFDAGFPVGGQLGIRAGTVLGILEGVLRGYESKATSAVVKKQGPSGSRGGKGSGKTESEEDVALRRDQRERVLRVYQRALKELEVQTVFGVLEETGDSEKAEEMLARKGDVVVAGWEDRVKVAHWEENMEALELKEKTEQSGQS